MTGQDLGIGSVEKEFGWRTFARLLIGTALGVGLFVYLLVLIIDPYDSVPFSPGWERYPVTSQARPYNAKLARSGRFDSAVVGNSTSMLLHPDELDAVFGGRFANLAMVGASPYEQLRMLELMSFGLAYRGTLIIGVDPFWCAPDGSPRLLTPMLGHEFPKWLYDDNRWNDLPPFNKKTLQHARSQMKALVGFNIRYPLRPNGYRDFTATYRTDRDLASVRKRIYGEGPWALQRTNEQDPPSFPDIDALAAMLRRFPAQTLKIGYFVPFHAHHQAKPGSDQFALWNACKVKAAHVLGAVPNTSLLDFLIPSPITMEDSHYVDGQHYTTTVASDLARLLYAGVADPSETASEYRVLSRPDANK